MIGLLSEQSVSPVVVRFGLTGMGVAPAGVAKESTGHHHLVIDAELPPSGLPVPSSEHYRHFGGGQTEGAVRRVRILERFARDDEGQVKAVLHDLVESGLVFRAGRGLGIVDDGRGSCRRDSGLLGSAT